MPDKAKREQDWIADDLPCHAKPCNRAAKHMIILVAMAILHHGAGKAWPA